MAFVDFLIMKRTSGDDHINSSKVTTKYHSLKQRGVNIYSSRPLYNQDVGEVSIVKSMIYILRLQLANKGKCD